MGRSPPLPHHPQRRRQRGTADAQYAGRSGLINIKRDDALLHLLTGHYRDLLLANETVSVRVPHVLVSRVVSTHRRDAVSASLGTGDASIPVVII